MALLQSVWLAATNGASALAIGLFISGSLALLNAQRCIRGGMTLRWRSGSWCLQSVDQSMPVRLEAGSVAGPWVVLLVLRNVHTGDRLRLIVFPDSTTMQAMRQLRVRLRIERSGIRASTAADDLDRIAA